MFVCMRLLLLLLGHAGGTATATPMVKAMVMMVVSPTA